MTLELIASDALHGIRHGFFTRRGGASSGIFEGLNCGPGSTDQTEMVEINSARVAEVLDVAPDRLLTARQVHSARVVTVDGPFDGTRPEADALVTRTPGLALAILTADCQPVLLADRDAGVIGAAHAGWRGTAAGVLEATVAAMVAIGADRRRIAAVIGPTISQRNYEVGEDFLDALRDADGDALRYFANGEAGRYRFDLPGYGRHVLRRAGLASADWVGHCTYADPARFFSYRRSVHRREPDYGRLISAIRL